MKIQEYRSAFKAANLMIKEEIKLSCAIKDEDYIEAGRIQSYIAGMTMILLLFELKKETNESTNSL